MECVGCFVLYDFESILYFASNVFAEIGCFALRYCVSGSGFLLYALVTSTNSEFYVSTATASFLLYGN